MTNDADGWDRLGAGEYGRELPPATLSEAISGERRFVFLRADPSGRWRLTRGDGDVPLGPFDGLPEAKRAGEGFVAKADADSCARLVSDAGLDPEAWMLVSDRFPVEFGRIDDPAQSVAHVASGEWGLFVDDERKGTFDTPALAAASALAAPAAASRGLAS